MRSSMQILKSGFLYSEKIITPDKTASTDLDEKKLLHISLLCSGYRQKEAAVIQIILPFVYYGFTHFTVHLRISSFFSQSI